MQLKGKVCLVTGGSSGIGKTCCELFTSLGAKVMICDINKETGVGFAKSLNEKYGSDVAVFKECNVADKDSFNECFKLAKQKFGSIDIVFNNAGIYNDSPSGWSRQIDINFKGVVNGCILAIDHMGTQNRGQGGIVINTASLLGLTVFPIMPIYAATKAAIVSLTRNFGTEVHYKLNKLTFMALCPNATGTALFNDLENKFLIPHEEIVTMFNELSKEISFQLPESVAKCVVEMINNERNGSIWLSEFDEPVKLVEICDVSLIRSDDKPTLKRQIQ